MSAEIDPVLIDVPERLETPRLILSPPRAGQGPAVNAAIVASLERLSPWMPWVHPVPSVDDTEAWSRKAHARFILRESLVYRFVTKGDDEVIGTAGLHRIDWKVRKFEIGYWVRTGFEGRGFVTEVAGALERLAFEQLGARRVEIRMDDRNERSWRVAERLGFTLEGILRKDSVDPTGATRDTRVYAKTS